MPGSQHRASSSHDTRPVNGLSSSPFLSSSPLAERYLAEDIAACSDTEDIEAAAGDEHDDAGPHLRIRRPSGVAFGGRPVLNTQIGDEPSLGTLSALERKQSRDQERSLLRDNNLLPPKHRHHHHHHHHQEGEEEERPGSAFSRLYRRVFVSHSKQTKKHHSGDEETPGVVVQPPDETAPLLGTSSDRDGAPPSSSSSISDAELDDQWAQAVSEGRIRTTWQREAKTLTKYSAPLIATFLLQYSINVTSIFAVGRIGKIELGAVSLANMSAAITCLAPFQGLATSLDTLCAQAYGSGHKTLVGLQLQRMTCFLFLLSVPVAVLWLFSEPILKRVVPEAESARLASLYLKVMIFSIPGFVLFECGKRFTQAQGLFRATTYVLIVAAPLNILLSYLLVWHLGLGFVGAPMAVAITDNILPILLFLYVRFVDGSQCWGGFTKRALSNWWVMIRLALPGMVMIEAEWLAFELMTLLASRFGSEYLAAQSVLVTLATISYQIPFPVSIGASTRIANLIGAGLVDAAKTAAKVAFCMGCIIGVFNLTMYSSLRFYLPRLFTRDDDVIAIVAHSLPVVALTQVFDGLCAGAHGLLRGIGKQSIGGPANLFAYYVISLPISLGLAFGLDMKLDGLWLGVTVGLICAALIEYTYLIWTNWENAAAEAQSRNEAG